MYTKQLLLIGKSYNPYLNLAVESYLLKHLDNAVLLYLWQNDKTVVIGYNQNPYQECRLDTMKADGCLVARRRTGGGAVYHDVNNLNFSFIAPCADYSVEKQLQVIIRAARSFGIQCLPSGRNDLVIADKKFSGNAYLKTKKNCLHHGTLLINTDTEKLQAYLTPQPVKLHKRGVSSLAARVTNLEEYNPAITPISLRDAICNAFEEQYTQCEYLSFEHISTLPEVVKLAEQYALDSYVFGNWQTFVCDVSGVFEWGLVKVQVTINNDRITDVVIESDCLYVEVIECIEKGLQSINVNDIMNLQNVFNDKENEIFCDIIALVARAIKERL